MAWAHELASTRTGSSPSPVHRQSLSTIAPAIHACASANPLEPHGVAQQTPATSGGIQTGRPARSETLTRASGRGLASPFPWAWEGPKVRLMQAGKYTAAAVSRRVAGSLAGAALGIG